MRKGFHIPSRVPLFNSREHYFQTHRNDTDMTSNASNDSAAQGHAVERGAGVAVWRQIEQILSAEIAAKSFGDEGRLPSEAELARRFGVNRHTICRSDAAARGNRTRQRRTGPWHLRAAGRDRLSDRPAHALYRKPAAPEAHHGGRGALLRARQGRPVGRQGARRARRYARLSDRDAPRFRRHTDDLCAQLVSGRALRRSALGDRIDRRC